MGERLIKLRKSKKWTQQDVADKINISRSAYAGYELGRRVPEYATLEKMANLFGVSIDFMVGRDEQYLKPTKEQSDYVIREMVEKYNIDLSDPQKKKDLERIIQFVFDKEKDK